MSSKIVNFGHSTKYSKSMIYYAVFNMKTCVGGKEFKGFSRNFSWSLCFSILFHLIFHEPIKKFGFFFKFLVESFAGNYIETLMVFSSLQLMENLNGNFNQINSNNDRVPLKTSWHRFLLNCLNCSHEKLTCSIIDFNQSHKKKEKPQEFPNNQCNFNINDKKATCTQNSKAQQVKSKAKKAKKIL